MRTTSVTTSVPAALAATATAAVPTYGRGASSVMTTDQGDTNGFLAWSPPA